jgi:hypothetical protein
MGQVGIARNYTMSTVNVKKKMDKRGPPTVLDACFPPDRETLKNYPRQSWLAVSQPFGLDLPHTCQSQNTTSKEPCQEKNENSGKV